VQHAAFPLTASPSQAGGERHSRESDACVSLCLPHWLLWGGGGRGEEERGWADHGGTAAIRASAERLHGQHYAALMINYRTLFLMAHGPDVESILLVLFERTTPGSATSRGI
jgi:hypothetical protein